MEEQDKYKSISEDLEQAFAEMSGYWYIKSSSGNNTYVILPNTRIAAC